MRIIFRSWMMRDSQSLKNLSFQSEKSEQIAIVGPSSGGKDLAAILLARLLVPDGGQIKVADKLTLDFTRGGHLGGEWGMLVRQPSYLILSLRENILLGAMHQPMKTATAAVIDLE